MPVSVTENVSSVVELSVSLTTVTVPVPPPPELAVKDTVSPLDTVIGEISLAPPLTEATTVTVPVPEYENDREMEVSIEVIVWLALLPDAPSEMSAQLTAAGVISDEDAPDRAAKAAFRIVMTHPRPRQLPVNWR